MRLASFEAIVRVLQAAGVRYLVAGGLAVAAHGYVRVTQDVDLGVALATLGYRPLVPITAVQFADAELRCAWIRDKGMRVLNFYSDRHRETNVDLFVTVPFDFAREYANAMRGDITPGVSIPIVSLPTLIAMKAAAGRTRDLDDIEHLRWILEDRNRNE